MIEIPGVIIKLTDYKDRTFRDFYAAKDSIIPGWVVFGKGEEYDGRLRMICARPDVKPRKYKWLNGRFSRGWHTKREAQAIADKMNAAITEGGTQ